MYVQGIRIDNPGRDGYIKMTRRYSGRARERYWEIDFLRGLCVFLMIFDHFMHCIINVMPTINGMLGTHLFEDWYQAARWYCYSWSLRQQVWLLVTSCFFLLCGISSTLTRGNFRRFVPLALVACGITLVTQILDETLFAGSNFYSLIQFGVVHMIAAGILLYALLDNAAVSVADALGESRRAQWAKKAVRFLPGLVGIALFIVYLTCFGHFNTDGGFWRFTTDVTLEDILGAGATKEQGDFLSMFLDLRGYSYRSSDYFPILPYAAIILMGGIIGRLVYHTDAKYTFARFDGAWNKPLCFLGRHAAFIYVVHMIVIPCVLALFALIVSLF